MDASRNVYVSEYAGARVDKFSPSGALLLSIPTAYTPGGVAVGADGTIDVAQYNGGVVYRYSGSGAPLGVFASPGGLTDFIRFDATGNLYAGSTSISRMSPGGVSTFVASAASGRFEGIAFDATGNLYVGNDAAFIIEKFSASGADLGPFAARSREGRHRCLDAGII